MIPLRCTGPELEAVIVETTRRSGLRHAYVQVIATRGRRPSPSMPSHEPTLIVYAIPYVWLWPQEKADSGISVVIPTIRQWPASVVDAKIKNFNRMHTHLARIEADQAGADDVVLLDDRGLLTESRGANLFLVRGGRLYTPQGGILEGITRETVFEIAAELEVPAAERDLTPYDLYTGRRSLPLQHRRRHLPHRRSGRAACWHGPIGTANAADPRAILGAARGRSGRDAGLRSGRRRLRRLAVRWHRTHSSFCQANLGLSPLAGRDDCLSTRLAQIFALRLATKVVAPLGLALRAIGLVDDS